MSCLGKTCSRPLKSRHPHQILTRVENTTRSGVFLTELEGVSSGIFKHSLNINFLNCMFFTKMIHEFKKDVS